jgi:D-glycero-alpha-D-manno-heptose-7-phosphate kinase
MIISRTPVRLPFGGGGTDLPSYYSKYESFFVSAAINKYIYITVNKMFEDNFLIKYSKTERVDKPDDVEHPIIREVLKMLKIAKNTEITSMAEVPSKSGMGSSGSFTVGLLNALHTFKNESISKFKLAEEAFNIEAIRLNEPHGKQDHYIAAFGGINAFKIDKKGIVTVKPLDLKHDILNELENNLLLFHTGIRRRAADVLSVQSKAIRDDERVLESMHKIKEIGKQSYQTLKSGNTRKFGELMHEHWLIKKSLTDVMSNEPINKWYDVGKKWAVGGKLMGAGGGGFLLFYCEDNKDKLRRDMAKEGLREFYFKFDFTGSKILANV